MEQRLRGLLAGERGENRKLVSGIKERKGLGDLGRVPDQQFQGGGLRAAPGQERPELTGRKRVETKDMIHLQASL